MNQNSDTEMDLLLRRHARRKAAGASAGTTARAMPDAQSNAGAHLDADELSAYAEGALPERARTRYSAHLADCDTCRKIVTQLVISNTSEAEAVAPVTQTVNEPNPFWRRWFAALLSPPALRFAAPALALMAFVAIMVVVVTRNRDVTNFVSQNERNAQQPANTGAEQRKDEQPAGTTTANVSNENHGTPASANSNSIGANSGATQADQQGQQKESDQPQPPAQTEGAPADGVKAPEVAQREQPSLKDQERVTEEGEAAKPAPGNLVLDKNENQPKAKDDATLAAKRRADGDEVAAAPSAAATTTNSTTAGGRAARSAGATGGGAYGSADSSASEAKKRNEAAKTAPAPATRMRRDTTGEDEASIPTRNVAGKRFQLRNGVWVDTAYNSSRGATRIKRGSEQYRALVADEPLIATVSNELGGALIVVVKGRAYHIY